eukprot:gene11486-4650_t
MIVGHLIPSNNLNIIKLELNERIKIGRSKNENTFVVGNPLISGVHLEISIISEDQIEIEDKSSNGIVINNEKLGKGKKIFLKNGDLIFLIEEEYSIKLNLPYFKVSFSKQIEDMNIKDEKINTQELESRKRKRIEEDKNEKKKILILKEMNELQKKQFELLKQMYIFIPKFDKNIIQNILLFLPLISLLEQSIFFISKSFFEYFNENSMFWKYYCLNLWRNELNFKSKNFINWKNYLLNRGKYSVQSLLMIQKFISNPNDELVFEEIHYYIGAYKLNFKNCTYLKYLSNNNSTYCECLLWSLKFPNIFVEVKFEAKQNKFDLIIDDTNAFVDGKLDDYLINSVRETLNHDGISTNQQFLVYLCNSICRFECQLQE